MDESIHNKASEIWQGIGQYKNPADLQIEIEIYKKLLGIFQVGEYCYFIFNPPQMRIEYTNDSIRQVLGYSPEEFTLEKFLQVIHPEDLTTYLNFEATITEFWQKLPPEKVFKYKTRYDFRIICKDGTVKRLLQQVAVVQSDEQGAVLRTFVTFTDITDLKQNTKMVLSIIGLENEPSYIDITPIQDLVPHKSILSKREKEIFKLLVEDYQSSQIAEMLNIALHTVGTHRKNIFRKTGTNSTIQLLRLGLEKGWI